MSTLPLSTHCITLPALRPGHHNTGHAHPPSWLPQASTPPGNLLSFAYLCLLEEDRPATMPVIPTQDYSRAHKDPKEATKIYGSL
ncbi:hypothetical protein E2C01_006360 [Portunus trituberculatus]|uniref:Uncharacterized protein n=1 Tax=Portunus trituberculatus TaxID=210409 RepID=A0A5B7CW62_PORTR|nr:hypothetical protein [Portunus trituberculatus]